MDRNAALSHAVSGIPNNKEDHAVNSISRRRFIAVAGVCSVGTLTGGCAKSGGEEDVSAVEDLMREHGVLRRALLVYVETAPKLRANPDPSLAEALQRTARLFRTFGEDYHEKKLEEEHIFPALKQDRSAMSELVDALIAQHERGREITDYILAVTQSGRIEGTRTIEIAGVLESFVLMYQNHTAREDTIVFPAWKMALPAGELEKMGDTFEDIEHTQFGADGFESAVRQITEIETVLGLADLGQFTAPLPPRALTGGVLRHGRQRT